MYFLYIALLFFAMVVLYKAVRMVPQGFQWTVETFGKYTKTLSPGLHILIPIMQDIGRKVNMMEQVLDVNSRAEKEHFKIKRFALLYKLLDVDDGELTKTGKIRRKFVQERYQNLYDALYDETIDTKEVEASSQYQDGQSNIVKTTIAFYTVKGV